MILKLILKKHTVDNYRSVKKPASIGWFFIDLILVVLNKEVEVNALVLAD